MIEGPCCVTKGGWYYWDRKCWLLQRIQHHAVQPDTGSVSCPERLKTREEIWAAYLRHKSFWTVWARLIVVSNLNIWDVAIGWDLSGSNFVTPTVLFLTDLTWSILESQRWPIWVSKKGWIWGFQKWWILAAQKWLIWCAKSDRVWGPKILAESKTKKRNHINL